MLLSAKSGAKRAHHGCGDVLVESQDLAGSVGSQVGQHDATGRPVPCERLVRDQCIRHVLRPVRTLVTMRDPPLRFLEGQRAAQRDSRRHSEVCAVLLQTAQACMHAGRQKARQRKCRRPNSLSAPQLDGRLANGERIGLGEEVGHELVVVGHNLALYQRHHCDATGSNGNGSSLRSADKDSPPGSVGTEHMSCSCL